MASGGRVKAMRRDGAPAASLAEVALPEAARPDRTLRVDGLWVRRGGREVLRGVSLEVTAATGLLITGANGAGKTTLLRAILGFLKPQRGAVTFGGRRLRLPAAGYVPQGSPAGDLPIAAAEVVAIGTVARRLSAAERRRAVAAAMDDTECRHLRRRRYAELSGGERQRVSLARCLAQDARLLLLDEPTASLDAAARTGVLELLERLRGRRGLAVLMASHDADARARVPWPACELRDGRVGHAGA